MDKEYRVEVKVRNNLILAAMKENGIATVAELCRRMDTTSAAHVGDIINLKLSPRTKGGEWRPIVLRIAKALKCLPEDLFTPEQEWLEVADNKGDFEVSMEDIRGIKQVPHDAPSLEDLADAGELRSAIARVLCTLTPREERVVRMRFGLGVREHTLEEVGQQLGKNRERIRQIEAKAIRKLKHPSRASLLGHIVGERVDSLGQTRWGNLDQRIIDALGHEQ